MMISTQLTPSDLLPIAVIVLVSFALKTGILSALAVGIKKQWQRFRDKKKKKDASGVLFYCS